MSYLVRGEPAPGRPEGAIEPDPSLPRACVIGAGSCGIAAAKVLYEARVPFDCFEAGPVVGGLWVFENPNGRSGCYSTLEMNTSGPRMSYSDFPLGFEDYPPCERRSATTSTATSTTSGFATRSPSRPRSSTSTRGDDGGWEVELSTGETRAYDAIVVANGHHWDPRWPEPPFPGEFNGLEMHSHDYRRPEQLAGKRVIVVGGGNSGIDIARDAADFADEAYLSLRRGVHVIRKRIGRQAQAGRSDARRRRGCRGR